MSGVVHRDGEGAHDAGNGRLVGESDDDRKIVLSGGEDEIAVEDALHDGIEEGMGGNLPLSAQMTYMRATEMASLKHRP